MFPGCTSTTSSTSTSAASRSSSTRSAASTPTSTTATTTTPAVTDYSSIDIQPGYQKLCGRRRAGVRALPPHRQRHRPQRAPAGLHPLGQGASSATAQILTSRDKLLKIFGKQRADRSQPAHDRRADQPVRPGRVLGRPHDQADPVPGHRAAVQPGGAGPERRHRADALLRDGRSSAEQSAFHAFMTPDQAPPPSPHGAPAHAGAAHGTGAARRTGGGGAALRA